MLNEDNEYIDPLTSLNENWFKDTAVKLGYMKDNPNVENPEDIQNKSLKTDIIKAYNAALPIDQYDFIKLLIKYDREKVIQAFKEVENKF